MSKYDLTDGFYQIFLALDDALKLAIMMPHYEGETQLTAVPLSLTMGWTKLPPTFSATSETAANLTNVQLTCCSFRKVYHSHLRVIKKDCSHDKDKIVS